MAHRMLLIRLKRETVYWFCYLLKVSAYIAVFLCCHQQEHLRLSITCFSLSSVVLFLSFLFILILPFFPLWISPLLLSWWTEMEQAHISLSLSHTLWVYAHLSYCAALVTSAPYEVCVFVCTYNMSIFGVWLNMCVWNVCVCSRMDTCTNLLYVQTCDTECAFTYVYWVCLDYFEHGCIQASMRAAVGACVRACVCIILYQLLCWNLPETIFPQVSRYHDKWARHHWDNHNTPQQYISITSHCLK